MTTKITARMVKELRTLTGASMGLCRNALVETNGDVPAAKDWLRKKGLAKASKKASRSTTEGAVASYIHAGGKIGVLVEINCETDFAAQNEQFQALVRDIAMQIAAAAPTAVRREDLPAEMVERERSVLTEQARTEMLNSGKPEHVADKIAGKMVEGRMRQFYEQHVLLDQPYVKDDGKKRRTIDEYIKESVALIGENISVRRFARFVLGEGLEKKSDDFAAEVAAMAGGK